MRCLSDEQIELLIEGAPNSRREALRAHAEACVDCRRRLALAREEAVLIRDVRELRESRNRVKPLLDGVLDSGRASGDNVHKPKP